MDAISVSNLRKTYDAFEAVRSIDFTVSQGQVFAFLGPNGAGKTTTVEILEGYRTRTEGSVRVLGFDPETGGAEMRSRIGIVLQSCGFPRYATVQELLTLNAKYYPSPRPVDEVIELVGLRDKHGDIIRTLSGGQQRRLDLALALIGDPELIFLDEPTTGFDPGARREAWDTVSNLRSLGKTIFLTTHYMDEAQYLADRVAVIAGGVIVAEGPPSTLGGRNAARTQIQFELATDIGSSGLPVTNDVEIFRNGTTVVARTDDPTPFLYAITEWAIQRGEALEGLSVSKPSLEDIYLQLTAEADDTRLDHSQDRDR